MDTAIASLIESLERDEPRTEEEYEAAAKVLLTHLHRTLDQIEADRRASDEIGAEMRAITERIRAI